MTVKKLTIAVLLSLLPISYLTADTPKKDEPSLKELDDLAIFTSTLYLCTTTYTNLNESSVAEYWNEQLVNFITLLRKRLSKNEFDYVVSVSKTHTKSRNDSSINSVLEECESLKLALSEAKKSLK